MSAPVPGAIPAFENNLTTLAALQIGAVEQIAGTLQGARAGDPASFDVYSSRPDTSAVRRVDNAVVSVEETTPGLLDSQLRVNQPRPDGNGVIDLLA